MEAGVAACPPALLEALGLAVRGVRQEASPLLSSQLSSVAASSKHNQIGNLHPYWISPFPSAKDLFRPWVLSLLRASPHPKGSYLPHPYLMRPLEKSRHGFLAFALDPTGLSLHRASTRSNAILTPSQLPCSL